VFGIDLNESGLQNLKQAYPETFAFWVSDVRLQEEIAESIRVALKEFVRIDILINSAGNLDDDETTLDTTEELWDEVFQTNVKSVYYTTNLILPHMLKWEKGIVINTASSASTVAGCGGAAYTASKHAIIGYTKQLSFDYSRKGIRANVVVPGGSLTGAREAANTTMYMASDATAYLHGAVIPANNGWVAK
jgi:3-oxoacyl-[acyl-carrier protein] reductase